MNYVECVCWMILMLSPGYVHSEKTTVDPPGHNQPIGSHTKHLDVPMTNEFPLPRVFFEEYMVKSRPLIIKSILNATTFPAVAKWTDNFLRTLLGKERVVAEPAKKEVRQLEPEIMPLNRFLDVYKNREVYMVQGVEDFQPKTKARLMDDVYIPRSLVCGGLQFSVESLVLWFSSGGTKSVLHLDDYENFNCVLDGTKELIFIDKKYKEQVESVGFHEEGSYSDVDVDKVDMYKFPGLQETTVYKARLTKGDCLYIPYQWYHQVNSPGGRSLAINFWFVPTLWFNETNCENKDFTKQTEPIHKYGINHEDFIAWNKFIWIFKNGDISKKLYEEKMAKDFPELRYIQDEIFNRLDRDGSVSLSMEELYEVDAHQILEEFPAVKAVGMSDNKELKPETRDEL